MADEQRAAEEEDLSEAALDEQLRLVDDRVGRVHAALPVGSMLLVATGQGDTAECRRLQVRETSFWCFNSLM